MSGGGVAGSGGDGDDVEVVFNATARLVRGGRAIEISAPVPPGLDVVASSYGRASWPMTTFFSEFGVPVLPWYAAINETLPWVLPASVSDAVLDDGLRAEPWEEGAKPWDEGDDRAAHGGGGDDDRDRKGNARERQGESWEGGGQDGADASGLGRAAALPACPGGTTRVDSFGYGGVVWSACEDLRQPGGSIVLVSAAREEVWLSKSLLTYLLTNLLTCLLYLRTYLRTYLLRCGSPRATRRMARPTRVPSTST